MAEITTKAMKTRMVNSIIPSEGIRTAEVICIDTETTGKDKTTKECLQLAIVDARSGETLFCEYFKPVFVNAWEEAQKIHHISPKMVADKPRMIDRAADIKAILVGAKYIVGYNVEFDIEVLQNEGFRNCIPEIYSEPMKDFAPIYGEWNERRHDYKWKKLTDAAEYFGYDWGEENAHDALSDAKASAFVWRCIEDYKKTHPTPIARPSYASPSYNASSSEGNRTYGNQNYVHSYSSPQYYQQTYIVESVSQKSKWCAFFLCLFLGYLGAHKFYVGKKGMGILYLFTFGLFGFGWLIDLVLIACGKFTDSKKRRLV